MSCVFFKGSDNSTEPGSHPLTKYTCLRRWRWMENLTMSHKEDNEMEREISTLRHEEDKIETQLRATKKIIKWRPQLWAMQLSESHKMMSWRPQLRAIRWWDGDHNYEPCNRLSLKRRWWDGDPNYEPCNRLSLKRRWRDGDLKYEP